MSKKIIWGVSILIILLIGVSAVLLLWNTDTKPPITIYKGDTEPLNPNPMLNTKDNPPRDAKPGFKWEWHEDHWHEMPIVSSDAPAAVKPERTKRTKSDPLNIDWGGDGFKSLDWTDPRTAESYSNYYGFDPPTEENYFRRVQDNFGTWIQNYPNTSVVVKWGKRIGFRPTVAQFERYKQLKAKLELAQTLSLTGESTPQTERIQQEIRDLVANAQGEIPTLVPRNFVGYYLGKDKPTPEHRKRLRDEANRALYKRLGIEHLYEFYEVDLFK